MTYNVAHRGLRVPWVARWSPEESRWPIFPDLGGPEVKLAYADQRPGDVVLDTLWMREYNDLQGTGLPEYGVVSTTRQRACMLERRCQVCGEQIAGDVTPYVFPKWVARKERTGKTRLTSTPPTCKTCIPIAMKLCPILRKNENVYFEVFAQRPVGVFGDRWLRGAGGRIKHDQGETPLGATYVLGRMVIMELQGFHKRPLPT